MSEDLIAYLTRWADRLERASEDPRYTVTSEVAQMMREDAAQLRRAIAALTTTVGHGDPL